MDGRQRGDEQRFEACYVDVRDRLLLQTYALTGDLAAAQKAVQDALVIAWHHWPKVSRLADQEAWIRPLAWSHAQRRHTARVWHREKPGEDPGADATLQALGELPPIERKVLLLAHLTTDTPEQIAREAGVTLGRAERELDLAMTTFAAARQVSPDDVHQLFEPLRDAVAGVRWPRATILMRDGRARRRTHTLIGAVAAVATLVVSGAVVTDAAGVHPDLADKDIVSSGQGHASTTQPSPEPEILPADLMLGAPQVSQAMPGRWVEEATSFNASGDGLSLPCQQTRYADGNGLAVLLRTFGPDLGSGAQVTTGQPRDSAPTAAQLTEVSGSAKSATRAYDTELTWFTDCTDPRMQLMATLRVTGVGDRAALIVLHDWSAPERSLVVGVAQTGAVTTATVGALAGADRPSTVRAAQLLGKAVSAVCHVPGAGECTTEAAVERIAPPPVSTVPALLGEIDLPPVSHVTSPWAGSDPAAPTVNAAATRCDEATFDGKGVSHASTRTFVIPAATRLPPQFGLTETVGAMGSAGAKVFVADVRDKLASCADREAGTTVKQVRDLRTRARDLTVYRVTVQISDKESVRYLMAIARTGGSVAQVGFVPSGDVQMAGGAFAALAERALDRLGSLPPAG